MDATQFIKEYGVEKAREVVSGAPEGVSLFEYIPICSGFSYIKIIDGIRYCFNPAANNWFVDNFKAEISFQFNDIKRLVESVDLVNCNGVWNGTKNTITLFQSSLDLGLHHGVDGVDAEVEIPRLKQAIADYEVIYSIPKSVRQAILNLEMHL